MALFYLKSNTAVKLVDATKVLDNGVYAADGNGATQKKAPCSYSLTILSSGTIIGSAGGVVVYSPTGNKFKIGSIEIDEAEVGETYDYTLEITGYQNSIRDLPECIFDEYKYNYSASTISTTLSGSITTAAMGSTDLTVSVPSTWNVAGITKIPVEPEIPPAFHWEASGIKEPIEDVLYTGSATLHYSIDGGNIETASGTFSNGSVDEYIVLSGVTGSYTYSAYYTIDKTV